MHVGDHGAERELPFEAEPQVDQDADDREPEADYAIGQQLAGHARPHHLDAAVVDLVAERAAYFGDRLLLGRLATRLLGDTNQHVVRCAELLELNFAKAEPIQRRAHLGKIGGWGLRLYLDQSATLEVDAEIQTVKEIE